MTSFEWYGWYLKKNKDIREVQNYLSDQRKNK